MVVLLKILDVGVMFGFFVFYLYFLLLWNLFLGVMKEKS